ncbi:MAG: NAD-dependent deacylase [Firmicutes bacterium]|nr:NAD-dependent deacylase [Bacillota bacterium]
MAREKGLFLPSPCHDWQESPFQKPKVFWGGPAALHGGTLHHSGTSRRRWSMASADLESLAQALKQGRVAVLTGAGCSTESGIPDYRGSQGLWKRHPTELGTVYGMETWPEEFYAFYAARVRALKEARPNKAHRVLARFQKEGLLEALITQNVDGLHQAAGATDVIEVHGSMAHTRCQRCGRKDSPDRLLEPVTGRDDRPACRHCGGPMRPDIVLYGEQLPPEAMSRAWQAARSCRLFLVVGTSLQVAPVSHLPGEALLAGASLAIINLDPTPYDGRATWVIREKAGEALGRLAELMGLELEEEEAPPTANASH